MACHRLRNLVFIYFLYLFINIVLFFKLSNGKMICSNLSALYRINTIIPLFFIPLLKGWGYCERLRSSVHPFVRSSRYLLLNHWAEFHQKYMTSLHGKGVREQNYFHSAPCDLRVWSVGHCLSVRLSVRPSVRHTISS